jgi:hypothetical protein
MGRIKLEGGNLFILFFTPSTNALFYHVNIILNGEPKFAGWKHVVEANFASWQYVVEADFTEWKHVGRLFIKD